MNIDSQRQSNSLVIKPQGRIDGNNAHDFQVSFTAMTTDSDDPVIVDMSGLIYISSAGLRAVLLIAKALRKRGVAFALCALSPSIKKVLEMSGFDKIIAIHDSQADAIAAIQN